MGSRAKGSRTRARELSDERDGRQPQGVDERLIVSAFHHSLSTQAQVLIVAFVVVAVVLVVGRLILALLADPDSQRPGGGEEGKEEEGGRGSGGEPTRTVRVTPEPPAQCMEPSMQSTPAPSAHGSPAWLVSAVHWGLSVWENHPVQAAVAAVWIQLGLGLWLLLVVRGRWSRIGGLVSIGWALSVWVLGESMGGIFAPGASWLFGAPGAVLFYALAGALLALPERTWRNPRLGRHLLTGFGVYFVAMAVLQAWPGNGFWTSGSSGALPAMVSEMAETPQPHALAQVVGQFGGFAAEHAVLVNAFVVATLGAIGIALLSGRRRAARAAVGAALVVGLADWVLVQDFGVWGGVGTDPNSMIPTLLVLCASYLALVRPALATAPAPATAALEPPPSLATTGSRLPAAAEQPVVAATHAPAANTGLPRLWPAARVLAIVAACATTALGAVPYAIAAVEPNATTLLAESIDGAATQVPGNLRPPNVPLLEQHGRPISFEKLHGKVLLVTYLDPVCTTDCPIIAQELKQADSLLGGEARNVDLVAINANPLYRSPAYLRAFDHQEHLEQLPNWIYLTGSVGELRRLWSSFGVEIYVPGGGAMVDHPDGAAIVDREGHIRSLANFDPGPATASTKSSFAVTLAQAARQALNEA